jgi:hypothetical protein
MIIQPRENSHQTTMHARDSIHPEKKINSECVNAYAALMDAVIV